MFERLKRLLQLTVQSSSEDGSSAPLPTLNDAYRLHREEDVGRFTELATEAFPDYASRIRCFGSDWLGRQFATDTGRIVDGEPQILLLEPGSGDVYQIPHSFDSFHGEEMLRHPNETVELALLEEWVATCGVMPSYSECIGYKIPMFLGGAHDFANLEPSDFEVYWAICGQLLERTRHLPPGTPIGRVTIG